MTVMSDLPAEEVEIIEDPDEVHKIYKQSFIDEQVHSTQLSIMSICRNSSNLLCQMFGQFDIIIFVERISKINKT